MLRPIKVREMPREEEPGSRPVGPALSPDEARWEAVVARERGTPIAFVYAVTTTGVYCRPGCASRRPRREHVRFFDAADAAAAAGFRPCRRCRPDRPTRPDPARARILAACRYIRAREAGPPRLADLAAHVGLSPSHLQRVFKRSLGVSPREYAEALRMERFRSELRSGRPIAAALYGAGFGSISRIYERADAELGMTPGRYQRGAAGERIDYATLRTPLGWLLLAATARGVCRVALGSSPGTLVEELVHEFPGADRQAAPEALQAHLEPLLAYLSGIAPPPELPLDIRATAFQRRVWQALRRIPAGTVCSYAELARGIGTPTATRAVAGACARNPVPLLVPCHRVIRSDGELGGYRLGTGLKRSLLRLECCPAAGAPDGRAV